MLAILELIERRLIDDVLLVEERKERLFLEVGEDRPRFNLRQVFAEDSLLGQDVSRDELDLLHVNLGKRLYQAYVHSVFSPIHDAERVILVHDERLKLRLVLKAGQAEVDWIFKLVHFVDQSHFIASLWL